jgi:uncharacterized protein YndB with AHSA1/START domain
VLIKIVVVLVVLLVGFLIFVSTRPAHFRYERSGVINAPPEKIFPYLSNFRLGAQWSPYELKDPNMKRNFIGTDGQVGSIEEFDGNRDAGSGKIELLRVAQNDLVEIKLTMTKPIAAENLVEYKLTREGAGTRFTWTMSGESGFLGKFVGVIIDCEKMVAGDFSVGIQNLKTLVEAQK